MASRVVYNCGCASCGNEWYPCCESHGLAFIPGAPKPKVVRERAGGERMINKAYTRGYLLDLVHQERERQEQIWGEQSHGLQAYGDRSRDYYVKMEELYKKLYDMETADDTISWETILLEELYEALAAETVEQQVVELVQLAAVVLAAAEDLERTHGKEKSILPRVSEAGSNDLQT